MALNYLSDVEFADQNTAYMNDLESDYVEVFADQKAFVEGPALNNMLDLLTIPEGKIVEAGVWKRYLFSQLVTRFGNRAKGYDIHQYTDADDAIVIGDFRTIHSDHAEDVAVFINGMGGWDTNTSSKQAGLDYANSNLVSGGYYIDSKYLWDIQAPDMSSYTNLTQVHSDNLDWVIYQKA